MDEKHIYIFFVFISFVLLSLVDDCLHKYSEIEMHRRTKCIILSNVHVRMLCGNDGADKQPKNI